MGSDGEDVLGVDAPGKDWSVFSDIVWWAPKKLATSVEHLVWWLWGGRGVLSTVMDTLNTLLLGWLFSAVLIVLLVKILYDKFLRGSEEEDILFSESISVSEDDKAAAEIRINEEIATAAFAAAEKKRQARRVPTIVPAVGDVPTGSAGPATGQDADAVRWINTVMKWLYREQHKAVVGPYLTLLNEMTAQTAIETGVLIEVLEVLPTTPSPCVTNIVIECSPSDSMSLSCDLSTSLHIRLQTTRTHRDVTTESEYAGVVMPLRGRISADILPHQCKTSMHFDGWPEVEIDLEGIRNNEVGLGEKELQEVIKEVVALSIRNMVLEINLKGDKGFPCFKRARELPDKVIPVGYDSMVREHQTHPPILKRKVPPVKPKDIPSVSLKECSYVPEEIDYDTVKPSNNILTLNVSNDLTISEEQLIVRNAYQYEREESFEDHPHEVEYNTNVSKNNSIPWDDGYVPAGFLEKVTAAARAKVQDSYEKSGYELDYESPIANNQPIPWDDGYVPAGFLEKVTAAARAKVQDSYHIVNNEVDYQVPTANKQHIPWEDGYVPDGFLEKVTAAAMAKVEEISLAGSMHDQSYSLPNSNVEIPVNESVYSQNLDYIPYDSEYEEEDADEYLERSPSNELSVVDKRHTPGSRKAEKFILNESEKSIVSKVVEAFSSKPLLSSQCKGIEALSQSSTPLGAMGLPHHPKSNFSLSLASPPPPPSNQAVLNGKRLLVKIVKATDIACDKSSVDSYTVVEMDEPNQRFTTATCKGTNSPFWDEQFLFDLSDITLELLFEMYDEATSGFLGLGIVGIEELVATPSQRQIIPLQARPYEDDVVSGSLTVEFLFLDGGDLPDLTVRCSNVQQSLTSRGSVHTTTTTTYAKAPLAAADMNGTDSVAASVLRDIERSPAAAPSASKSTLIIHASKKLEDEIEYEDNDNEYDENYVVNTLQYPFPSTTNATNATSPTSPTTTLPLSSMPATNRYTTSSKSTDDTKPLDVGDEALPIEDDERGRSRGKRKNSFFGTLKKRFSRSKVRSQSVEPTAVPIREPSPSDVTRTATVGRSISMERSIRPRPAGLLSVPSKRESRDIGCDSGSTRSSLSETSGLSSSSTRTYVNEASMLIVETVENGVVKHYLVPVSLQQRNKWRKRGTKLHVYNGHTFVAKHISSSLVCLVCSKNFNRRPGKQAYECRDCGLSIHKPCHVKTDTQCINSKVNNMDLVYIQDPREERKSLRNQRV